MRCLDAYADPRPSLQRTNDRIQPPRGPPDLFQGRGMRSAEGEGLALSSGL